MAKIPTLHITKNYQRYLYLFAIVIFVLLTACPIKSGIKSLAGIHTKTEHKATRNHAVFYGNMAEKCSVSETADTYLSQDFSASVKDSLPVLLFTALFFFGLACTLYKEKASALPSPFSAYRSAPIFIRCRKLIL